jgi:hypothetical protein
VKVKFNQKGQGIVTPILRKNEKKQVDRLPCTWDGEIWQG